MQRFALGHQPRVVQLPRYFPIIMFSHTEVSTLYRRQYPVAGNVLKNDWSIVTIGNRTDICLAVLLWTQLALPTAQEFKNLKPQEPSDESQSRFKPIRY